MQFVRYLITQGTGKQKYTICIFFSGYIALREKNLQALNLHSAGCNQIVP